MLFMDGFISRNAHGIILTNFVLILFYFWILHRHVRVSDEFIPQGQYFVVKSFLLLRYVIGAYAKPFCLIAISIT